MGLSVFLFTKGIKRMILNYEQHQSSVVLIYAKYENIKMICTV